MKVQSISFSHNWSWGLAEKALIDELAKHGVLVEREIMRLDREKEADVILCQQATLLSQLYRKHLTVCRLGGNKTFAGNPAVLHYLEQMKQCYAIIATNNFLFKIGKLVNERTYLIPNGLDLEYWCPKEKQDYGTRTFKVGFSGNISLPAYRQYKGYDLVKQACANLGVELAGTFYGEGQIPHDRMKEDFYYKIDCLVHPTLGEGSSNVIMESLSCGVPVITTKLAGLHGEELKEYDEVIFCSRDVESIQAKILLLAESSEMWKRISTNGRKYAERRHDIKKIALEFKKVFEECFEWNKSHVLVATTMVQQVVESVI